MTALSIPQPVAAKQADEARPDTLRRRLLANRRIVLGGGFIVLILGLCLVTLPWTANLFGMKQPSDLFYDLQHSAAIHRPTLSSLWMSLGTTKLGQSLLVAVPARRGDQPGRRAGGGGDLRRTRRHGGVDRAATAAGGSTRC